MEHLAARIDKLRVRAKTRDTMRYPSAFKDDAVELVSKLSEHGWTQQAISEALEIPWGTLNCWRDAATPGEEQGDANGLLSATTASTGETFEYDYDAALRLIRQSIPATYGGQPASERQTQFAWDDASNMTALVPPARPPHAFEHDGLGRVVEESPPVLAGVTTETGYSYNVDGLLEEIAYPDSTAIDFVYGPESHRLNNVISSEELRSYNYDDSTGQLLSITTAEARGLTPSRGLVFEYDGPLIESVQWTDGNGVTLAEVSQDFDDHFRTSSRTVAGSGPVAFEYTGDGLLSRAGIATLNYHPSHGLLESATVDALNTSFEYSEFADLRRLTTNFDSSRLFDASYTHDDAGRIRTIEETVDSITVDRAYHYDARGRLIEVEEDGLTTATYAYDANDNRIAVTDLLHDLDTNEVEIDDQDRLLQYGDWTFTYDARGRLLTRTDTTTNQTTAYDYDTYGALREVTLPDATSIHYTHDVAGRRIQRWVEDGSGTPLPDSFRRYVYKDALNPIAVLNETGDVLQRFVYGSQGHVPDYMTTPEGTFAFVTDHLGSVRQVINAATGEEVQRLGYDAFGQVLEDTNPGLQPFGFAGGLYDPETSLVRFGARDYDASVGRWTAKDPISFAGGDTNLYGYVGQDPVNLIDPSGLFVQFIVPAVSGLIGGISTAVGYTNNQRSKGNSVSTGQILGAGAAGFTAGFVGPLAASAAGFGLILSALTGAAVSGGVYGAHVVIDPNLEYSHEGLATACTLGGVGAGVYGATSARAVNKFVTSGAPKIATPTIKAASRLGWSHVIEPIKIAGARQMADTTAY